MAVGDLVVRNGTYEYNGLLLNDLASIVVKKVKGLFELPEFKTTGNSELPDAHGGHSGRDTLRKRTMTFELAVYADTTAAMHAKLRAIAGTFQPQDTPQALVYQKEGLGKLIIPEVVPKRMAGFDSDFDLTRGLTEGAVLLEAADPRTYPFALTTQDIVIPVSGVTNNAVVANPGNLLAGVQPLLSLAGPATNPRIANAAEGRTIAIDVVVPAGQNLVIDVAKRTVLLNGVDAYDSVRNDNQWWSLLPGNNNITFSRANNPANTSTLTVSFRAAYV